MYYDLRLWRYVLLDDTINPFKRHSNLSTPLQQLLSPSANNNRGWSLRRLLRSMQAEQWIKALVDPTEVAGNPYSSMCHCPNQGNLHAGEGALLLVHLSQL